MGTKSGFTKWIEELPSKLFRVYTLLWVVYALFLMVLMPHTAWTFSQFQQLKETGNPLAWMLAFSVECVIAIFTHKLSEFISITRKRKGWAAVGRYVNGYSVGLVMVIIISSFANLAYAVQFAGSLTVFTEWGVPKGIYEFMFGAMLPFVSLVFALVLSNMADDETVADPELVKANEQNTELRRLLRESERAKAASEQARLLAESRFGTVTDLAKIFLMENKKDKIVAIHQTWPGLPNSSIAIIAEASPAHVSEVVKGS